VPIYLTTTDPTWFLRVLSAVHLLCRWQGCPQPRLAIGTLSDRGPGNRAGFVYHQGAVWGAAVAPAADVFPVNQGSFAKPYGVGHDRFAGRVCGRGLLRSRNQGKVLTADPGVIEVEVPA